MPSLSKFNFNSPRAKLRIERILEVLATEHLSVHALAKRIHASPSLASTYIKHLRSGTKQVYIVGFSEPGEECERGVARYAVGNKADARRRPKRTSLQWLEIRSDPVKLAAEHERQRLARLKRLGRDHLIRQVRKYDPPLMVQVREFVEQRPGYTRSMIAANMDANPSAIRHALSDLKKMGAITNKDRGRNGGKWESLTKPPVRHAPVVTQKQGIFAALGI